MHKKKIWLLLTMVVIVNHSGAVISKDIYGHFSEHLGACIYGGIWVGTDSKIPNTYGIRNDVLSLYAR